MICNVRARSPPEVVGLYLNGICFETYAIHLPHADAALPLHMAPTTFCVCGAAKMCYVNSMFRFIKLTLV